MWNFVLEQDSRFVCDKVETGEPEAKLGKSLPSGCVEE